MTPNEIRAALRTLPEAKRQRIVRALRRHPEPRPLRALAIVDGDAFVLPVVEAEPHQTADAEESALLAARRVLEALLGEEVARWAWSELMGCSAQPPLRLRRAVSRVVAKLRRGLFAEGGRR